MITFAKGVTSGYLPLGGVIVDGTIAAPYFAGPGSPMLRHGATYAGHPTCCAAALAVLDAYEAEGLIARGQELEEPLRDALAPLAGHSAVGEVRAGLGLLGAVQLSDDALAADPGAVAKVAAGARAAGVLVRPLLRVFEVMRETFWLLALAVILLFVFFVALGAISPAEAVMLSIVVGALCVLWVVH